MAQFVGGPYDGREMEFNPKIAKTVRLPELDQWDVDEDPDITMPRHCPHVYRLEPGSEPPKYIYQEE